MKKGSKVDECTLSFLCNLFASWDAYEKNMPTLCSSGEDWKRNRVMAMEFAILGHILSSRNFTGVDTSFITTLRAN